LQENVYERLGSNEPSALDARIIAATNRDPLEAVRQGKLREDLYYRIQVFAIELPALRERPEDIPLLAEHFIHKLAAKLGVSSPLGISPDAIERMQAYRWPGNVREMENVMERAMVLSRGQMIGVGHLPQDIAADNGAGVQGVLRQPETMPEDSQALAGYPLEPAVEKLERRLIAKALEQSGGNKSKAARLLEISERTLWYKLKKYAIA
jgi:two-component system response regulator AtoC